AAAVSDRRRDLGSGARPTAPHRRHHAETRVERLCGARRGAPAWLPPTRAREGRQSHLHRPRAWRTARRQRIHDGVSTVTGDGRICNRWGPGTLDDFRDPGPGSAQPKTKGKDLKPVDHARYIIVHAFAHRVALYLGHPNRAPTFVHSRWSGEELNDRHQIPVRVIVEFGAGRLDVGAQKLVGDAAAVKVRQAVA